jgi:Flp pilus assembly protein TadD
LAPRLTLLLAGPAALLLAAAACAAAPTPAPIDPAPVAPAPPPALPPQVPVEALLLRAEALLSGGRDLDDLDAVLSEVRARSPGDARLAPLEAGAAELRGDDAAAAEAWRRVLRARPDAETRLKRGLALQRLGRDAEAEEELAVVRAERPQDRAARAALAELWERGGRLDEAESELVALTQLAPADPAPERRLAAFYRRHGADARAEEAERRARALEVSPRVLRPLKRARR